MPVTRIEHKGKEILFGDFTNMKDQEEILKDLLTIIKTIKSASGHVLFMCDFSGASIGTDFMKTAKPEAKDILRNTPITTAVTGITGLKSILVQGYIRFTNSKLRIFPSAEEAKDYLAGADPQ